MTRRARSAPGLGLCCPECGEALLPQPDALLCPACGGTRPLRDGIVSLSPEDCYTGEDPRPRLQAVLEEVRRYGWDEAIHRRLVRAQRELYWDIFEPLRADWFYLGEVARRGRALDLSEGWGGLSLRLGRLFEEVVAVDGVWPRAQFRHLLFQHEGLENVTSLHAPVGALPFAPASFDLVVLSDHLEWAARYLETPHPEAAQRELLSRVWQVLRPGGSLCLGVRNRFAPSSLTGRSEHGRPRWASVLPRPLSRIHSRLCRESPRHALTHSPAGYRRLLGAAGFTDIRIYAALPSHRRPQLLIPLEHGETLGWAAKLSLARRGRRLGLGGRVAHRLAARPAVAKLACGLAGSLIIWARRPDGGGTPTPTEGLQRLLTTRVEAEWRELGLNGAGPTSLAVVQLAGNWERGGKVNWFLFPKGAADAALVAKVARLPAEAERIAREHELLTWLRSLSPEVAAHLPKSLAHWQLGGHDIALQECLPWTPLRKELRNMTAGEGVAHTLRVSLPFLTALATHTREEVPSGAHPYLTELVTEARTFADDPSYPAAIRELFDALARLAERAQGLPFSVLHHGDLNVADFLVGPSGFRVLDWEWAVPRGLPFVDVFGLGITAASPHGSEAVIEAARALVQPAASLAPPLSEAAALAQQYCAQVGVPDSLRGPLAAASMLIGLVRAPYCRVSRAIITIPYDPEPLLVAGRALVQLYHPTA